MSSIGPGSAAKTFTGPIQGIAKSSGTAGFCPKICVDLIEAGEAVALTDIVFVEVLQGLRSELEAGEVEKALRAFPILRLEALEDFALAAELYRTSRRAGVTIRRTLDCLIAAPCVRSAAPLLHADADFDRLASCTPLRINAP